MFAIPKPGLIVLDPETFTPLPAEGMDVPESEYWVRRLADGDVSVRSEPTVTASKD